ncbi:endolytic transglycosylase MltG [Streptomyces sp. TRM66268-LWL]|uniref:Endolytic murein transglycosylase n=1 Tax=Streptomyces polyasparticus TaxID=2767826 RepID=A0ABR7SK17_9ACTN|nr:endolytic transglycosylase MltG [Streptomyces polyasparticus]MBC9715654.1 endolytic transglycosylase MltG [Streptomyces polyasparticus]
MTEYGRGQGPEPWHPEDPLYGDQGWSGQQAAGGQSPYGGQPQQHYPQQPQQHQQYDTGQQHGYQSYDTGQQPSYGGGSHGGYDTGQQASYGGGAQSGYPQHDYNGGWDTGQQPSYGAGPDPYGQPAQYGGEQPDHYRTPEAFPPPQPPGRRRAVPEQKPDWDPGPDQGEHAFFAGGGDDGDDYDDDRGRGGGRGDRRGRGGKGGKKRRSGCACLVVAAVFAGGIGGVGYFGYQFYQDRFGEAADYDGSGNGETVAVEIPKGAGGNQIGQILKDAGVVASVDAFAAAQADNPKGLSIQAGAYILQKEMSAEAAVAMLLDPKSGNNLVVIPGARNTTIYKEIDKRTGQEPGTTAKYAKEHWKELGVPKWALSPDKDVKDPLEGFLHPATYAVSEGMKSEDVLKKMVAGATTQFEDYNLESKAKGLGLDNATDILTVASIVQKEGNNKADFEKIARVVYNRLKPGNTETYGLLDMDSTVNYARGESKLGTGKVDDLRNYEDPYNTYWPGPNGSNKGLPPGPISTISKEALDAALNPAKGNWYYFVSIDKDTTLFAVTNEEHNKNREKYLKGQGD